MQIVQRHLLLLICIACQRIPVFIWGPTHIHFQFHHGRY